MWFDNIRNSKIQRGEIRIGERGEGRRKRIRD